MRNGKWMKQEQMLLNRVKKYGILIRIQMDRTITNNTHSQMCGLVLQHKIFCSKLRNSSIICHENWMKIGRRKQKIMDSKDL